MIKSRKNLRPLLLITMLLSLSACSRTAEQKALVDAVVNLGPSSKDTKLALRPVNSKELVAQLNLQGTMPSADYFRTAELLQEIASEDNNEPLARYAKGMISSFYENRANFTQSSFSESIYVEAMVGEAEPILQKELANLTTLISDSQSKISLALERSVTDYPWPKELKSLPELLVTVDGYVDWMLSKFPRLGIDPEFSRSIVAAAREEYAKFRPVLERLSLRLNNANTIPEALDSLEASFSSLNFNAGPEQIKLLAEAREVNEMANKTQDAMDALRLIIKVWRLVPPAEREAAFKPKAAELYDFLNGKSEASLDCLAAPICLNPVLEAARVFGILPKLREYGPQKLASEISVAVLDAIKGAVAKFALEWMPQAPIFLRDRMNAEIQKYQTLIAVVRKDMPAYAKRNVDAWAKTQFNQLLPGIESARINVTRQNGRYKIAAISPESGLIESGAETLGLSLSIANRFLPKEKNKLRASILGSVTKLLAIGGYRMPGGPSYSSYSIALDGPRNKLHNLKTVLDDSSSFGVPDSFLVNAKMQIARDKAEATSSVGAQAELLRGISAQIKYLRDWETNEFDEALGSVQVEDLVPEVPKGAIKESAFPKRLLLALAVGNAAIPLQNIIKKLSPAFLVLPNGDFLWGNQYKEIAQGKISAVAAMVNIENGRRGNIVRTADIARYILALDAFLDATQGIELTKSEALLDKNSDGVSVLDQFIEARQYMRLFMMGLTNYLVYVAQEHDGGFHNFHYLKPGKGTERAPSARLLSDQALAIRALSVAAKRLDMGIYSWAALDAYHFLNRQFWDEKQHFYAAKIGLKTEARYGKAGIQDLLSTIKAIRELEPFMNEESRSQWLKVEKPWLQALELL